MARERDYHAEYMARQERAHERGFSSYGEERQFKEQNREALDYMKEDEDANLMWREMHPTLRPEQEPVQAVAFYEDVVYPFESGELSEGEARHAAVAYFMEYEDMSQEEAIAAMRDIYGDSP